MLILKRVLIILTSPYTGKQIFGALISLPANYSEQGISAEWLVCRKAPQNIKVKDPLG